MVAGVRVKGLFRPPCNPSSHSAECTALDFMADTSISQNVGRRVDTSMHLCMPR